MSHPNSFREDLVPVEPSGIAAGLIEAVTSENSGVNGRRKARAILGGGNTVAPLSEMQGLIDQLLAQQDQAVDKKHAA